MKTSQLRWPSGESVRLGSCRLKFDFELVRQTNDFKIGIQSFPACRSLEAQYAKNFFQQNHHSVFDNHATHMETPHNNEVGINTKVLR